jgi:hypothetical protein
MASLLFGRPTATDDQKKASEIITYIEVAFIDFSPSFA